MSTADLERSLVDGPGWPSGLPGAGPLGGVRVLDLPVRSASLRVRFA